MKKITAAIIVAGISLLGIHSANAVSVEQTTSISAKAISDHECNADEWHFVITQVASEGQAPASIHVVWEDESEADVPLQKYTGSTAHYQTTDHLDSLVVSASATIYSGWEGQFNLSHGPCEVVTTTTTAPPVTTTTTQPPVTTTTTVPEVTTTTQPTVTVTTEAPTPVNPVPVAAPTGELPHTGFGWGILAIIGAGLGLVGLLLLLLGELAKRKNG